MCIQNLFILASLSIPLSPIVIKDQEYFYFEQDYSVEAKECMIENKNTSIESFDSNDLLYKTIIQELKYTK